METSWPPAQPQAADTSEWSLDTLAAAARARGIRIGRRQVRRILGRQEGVRWRRPQLLGAAQRQGSEGLRPKRTSSRRLLHRPAGRRDDPLSRRTGGGFATHQPAQTRLVRRPGHRRKALLDYGRGPEKVWVYGALRVRDGQERTFTAPSRNTAGSLTLSLTLLEQRPIPTATSTWSATTSPATPAAPSSKWLATASARAPGPHSRRGPAGSICRKAGGGFSVARRFAGQSFADAKEIDLATRVATEHLNARAKPWVWGRPQPPSHRKLRRRFIYCLLRNDALERVWQRREVIRRRTLLGMSIAYPSDLTDAEWACVQRYFPPLPTRGRPRTHPLRHVQDAIFYLVRSGCAWRYLPRNYPPWQTVFYHFRRLRLQGKWHLLYTALHRAERERRSAGTRTRARPSWTPKV